MGLDRIDRKIVATLMGDATVPLARLAERYSGEEGAKVSTVDGVKVDLPEGWVHVRKSNTEPIVRVYAESETAEAANALAERFKAELIGEDA